MIHAIHQQAQGTEACGSPSTLNMHFWREHALLEESLEVLLQIVLFHALLYYVVAAFLFAALATINARHVLEG